MIFKPTLGQEKACKMISEWYNGGKTDSFRLFGYAGTGKTTVVARVIDSVGIPPQKIAFLAPTNKACLVLRRRLQGDTEFPISHPDVHTIHRALYSSVQSKDAARISALIEDLKKKRNLPGANVKETDALIKKYSDDYNRIPNKWVTIENKDLPSEDDSDDMDDEGVQRYAGAAIEKTPLYGKSLIVIDEVSMMGFSASFDILRWGIPIIAIGDPAQLPPIPEKNKKPGNYFIPESGVNPDILLTEITRQAEDNKIILLSKRIRDREKTLHDFKGQKPGTEYGAVSFGRPIATAPDCLETNINLVSTHRTRIRVNNDVRHAAGFAGTWGDIPAPGEILFCQKTHYIIQKKHITVKGVDKVVSKRIPLLVNGGMYGVAGYKLKDDEGTAIKSLFSPDVVDSASADEKLLIELYDLYDETRKSFTVDFDLSHFKVKYQGGYGGDAARDTKYYLDFGYAITIHASQGSEFENVSIHVERLDCVDTAKIQYTAVTRAKQTLNIIYPFGGRK